MGMTPQIAITEIHPVGWTDSSHQIFNIQNDVILPNNMSRSHNQWVMKLMPHQDPITNLDFYGNTLPVLWDTGSMYSVISSHTVQKILPNWKEYIKNIDFHTLGPDSRQILCYGCLELDFSIMGDLYTDTFLVLHSEFDNTLIGYSFMKQQGITIKAGQYLTNSDKPAKYLNQITTIHTQTHENNIHQAIPLVLLQPAEIIPGITVTLQFGVHQDYQRYIPSIQYTSSPVVAIGNNVYEAILVGPDGTLSVPYTEQQCNMAYTLDEGTPSLAMIPPQGDARINNLVTPQSMAFGNPNLEDDQVECQSLEFSATGIHYPEVESAKKQVVTPMVEPTTIPVEVITNCHPCSTCKRKSFTMCDVTNHECALNINNISLYHDKACLFYLYHQTNTRNIFFIHCNDFYLLRESLSDFWTRVPIQGPLYSHFLVNQSLVLFIEGTTLTSSDKRILLAKRIQLLSRKYFLHEIYITGHMEELVEAIGHFSDVKFSRIQTTTGMTQFECLEHSNPDNIRLNNVRKIDSKEVEASIYTKDPKIIKQMTTIIQERSKLYAVDSFDIGTWSKNGIPYEIHIRLLDSTPVTHKFRPIHHSKLEQAMEIMKGLREAKIISRKVTPYQSSAVWTLKAVPMMSKAEAEKLKIPYVPGVESKTAKRPLRLTVNLRDINTKITTPACILPNIRSIFPEIRDSEVLTIVDLLSAYWCLCYSEASSRITGFSSGIPDEQVHCFNRVAMGLKSSQAALTSALFHTIGSLRQHVFSYSDNLVIHSDVATHAAVVNNVLQSLENAGFKLGISKSIFAITGEVKLFGLVYNPTTKTVSPDKSKMDSLSSLKAPTSYGQLRSFLGSINFIVNHLKGIGDDMSILFGLTRGDSSFKWTDEAQQSYERILEAVKNHHKLYVLDHKSVAILSVDSSVSSTGGVLCQIHPQTGKVMVNSYFQKLFSAQESRLMNFEREALGLISIYKLAANTVFGCKLVIACDCRAVVSIRYLANQNHKVSRWLSIIESHQPSITFIHMKNTSDLIKIADYISRTPPIRAGEVPTSKAQYTPTPRLSRDRRTSENDMTKIKTITSKVMKEPMMMEQYEIILDYLTSLSEEDLVSLDDETVLADQSFVIFRRNGCSPEKIEISQRLRPYRPLDEISLGNLQTSTFKHDSSVCITHPTDDTLPWTGSVAIQNITTMVGEPLPANSDSPLRFLQYFTVKFPHINLTQVIKLQKQDPRCKSIYEKCLNSPGLQWDKNNVNRFVIRQGILLHEDLGQENRHVQLYLPEHMLFDTLNTLHRAYAHPGGNRLLKLFKEHFYTPGVARHIQNLLAQCYFCAVNKPAQQLKRPLHQHTVFKTLDTPGLLFSTDIIKISNNANGTNSLLSFTCGLSLYTIAYPIKADMDSRGFIDILLNCFLPAVNFSAKFILSDNAPYYSSTITKQALDNLNIKQVTICPYSPSNNPSERVQKQILAMLKVVTQEKCLPANSWPQVVQYVISLMNSLPYSNVLFNLSPADVFFGRKCHPQGLIPFLQYQETSQPHTPLAEEMGKTRRILQNYVAHVEKIRKQFYQQHYKQNNNTNRNMIMPGDIVIEQEKAHNLMGYNKKLRPRYRNMYIVIKMSATAAFCRPLDAKNGTNLESMPLIKIDIKFLKKLKTAVLFPISSKIFNQNFNHLLPESMDFYYHENKEQEDMYLLPEVEPEEETDTIMIQRVTINKLGSNCTHSNLKNKNKKVRFCKKVHCLTLSRGKPILAVIPLNEKYTIFTETFFDSLPPNRKWLK